MKIKLSQGELKRQGDTLRQFERYLPTLLLKKQLLQIEISHQLNTLRERENFLSDKKKAAETWLGFLVEAPEIRDWLKPEKIITIRKNVAGIDIPVFHQVVFPEVEYDLFLMPLWIDAGLEELRDMVSLQEEIWNIETGISILTHELRITTQRVNLFEKVKIPEAKEAIRLIKIYLGDQMINAVGRSKIAKNKIEEMYSEEMAI
jgi:V/A-type H+-transporting ATPase subunit D